MKSRERVPLTASNQSGFALIAVILLLALLLSLGAVGARTAQIELQIAGNDYRGKQALELAESGLEHAFALIRAESNGSNGATNGFADELGNDGTGGALTALGTLRTLDDGNLYRCAQLPGLRTADGYCVRVVDNHDETAGLNDPTVDLDNSVLLVSSGFVAGARRTVEMRIERDPVYPCVLCGNLDFPFLPADVALVGGFSTDSYDSRNGSYSAISAGEEGHVRSNGSVTMSGALLAPIAVAGDVVAVKDVLTLLPPVSVSGNVAQFAGAQYYAPVAPCGPPYPANEGISGGLYDRTTGILLNVGLADVIRLQGGTSDQPREYCFSSILMTGVSQLQVDGPVHIRLTGLSTILGVVNMTSIPADLRVSTSVTQPLPFLPVNPGLVIGNVAGQLSMVVDAPNALVAFVGVLDDYFGQIVAGVPPVTGVAASMHYDEALQVPRVYRRGWRELRNHPPS